MQKLSMEALGRLTQDEYMAQVKTPLVFVLDNIRSALNVGSVFRTADAFALEKVYLCGITATPPHREILKTALGSTETVAWEHQADTTKAIISLKSLGYGVLAVEQVKEATQLQDFQWEKFGAKLALVLGNEVDGVSTDALPLCDGCLEIPQFGTKHSLNVAVCAGIVAWELIRKMKFNGT